MVVEELKGLGCDLVLIRADLLFGKDFSKILHIYVGSRGRFCKGRKDGHMTEIQPTHYLLHRFEVLFLFQESYHNFP